jgi:hypothetical protein
MRYGYTFRRIPLTRGRFAIVDVGDYERLSKYKWFAAKNGRSIYARRTVMPNDGRRSNCNIKMHRQILDIPEGKFVDHINHNGLDNRKANLRIVTKMQNNWNRRKRLGIYSSQYKGVTLLKRRGKWQSRIVYKDKEIFIGNFDDEASAARAYDAKAREVYGEFAALNFPVKS